MLFIFILKLCVFKVLIFCFYSAWTDIQGHCYFYMVDELIPLGYLTALQFSLE
jgi:hypothetical protein